MPTFRLGSANQSVIIISRSVDNSITVKCLSFLLYAELSFSRGWELIAKDEFGGEPFRVMALSMISVTKIEADRDLPVPNYL